MLQVDECQGLPSFCLCRIATAFDQTAIPSLAMALAGPVDVASRKRTPFIASRAGRIWGS